VLSVFFLPVVRLLLHIAAAFVCFVCADDVVRWLVKPFAVRKQSSPGPSAEQHRDA